MAIKNIEASTLDRLRNFAKEKGMSYQQILQLFMQEEFLRRLSKSEYVDKFVLKGGMFIYSILKFDERSTVDIDFLIRDLSSDYENIETVIKKIIEIKSKEFIKIKFISLKSISKTRKYPGVRVKMIGYINKVSVPFSLDLGVGDAIINGPVKREFNVLLPDYEKPLINTYSVESTISEKFDAILNNMELNSRMKDFFDIYYLSSFLDFDGLILLKAIKKTLEVRNTKYDNNSFEEIKKFSKNKDMLTRWKFFDLLPGKTKPNFDVVIERLTIFIEPIFLAIINNEEFSRNWNSHTLLWED